MSSAAVLKGSNKVTGDGHWETKTLLELATKIIDFRGRTPKKLGMHWGGGDIPALSAANVKDGWIDFDEDCYFGSDALYEKWMTKGDVAKGDIVFTTEAPLGNVAQIPDERRYIMSQRTILFKLDESRILNDFLFQVLRSESFQRKLAESSSGSTATGIQRKKLELLEVVCPPLDEQRAIAEALGHADVLISSLEQLIAKKRDIKQAAMQQLLTGRTRLPGFKGGWRSLRFGDVARIRNDKVVPVGKWSVMPCIELENVSSASGELNSVSIPRSAVPKYSFKRGDVLFGRLRAYLRKFWLAEYDGTCSTEIWPLCPASDQLVSEYLHLLVQTDAFIEAAAVSYGTHMPRSDWKILSSFICELPEVDEQRAVAQLMKDIGDELHALTRRLAKTRDLKQGMIQQLLTGKVRLI